MQPVHHPRRADLQRIRSARLIAATRPNRTFASFLLLMFRHGILQVPPASSTRIESYRRLNAAFVNTKAAIASGVGPIWLRRAPRLSEGRT